MLKYVCAHLWAGAHASVYVHVEARGIYPLISNDIFFDSFPPYILRKVSHLNPELTSLASLSNWLAPGSSLCLLTLVLHGHHTHLAFMQDLGTRTHIELFILEWQVSYCLSHLPTPLVLGTESCMLCSSGWSGTHCKEQPDPELTAIPLLQPAKHWDNQLVPQHLPCLLLVFIRVCRLSPESAINYTNVSEP